MRRPLIWFAGAALIGLVYGLGLHYAWSRDLGQWETSSAERRAWFQQLVQPDTLVSCCGEGDGYESDEIHVLADGTTVAVVTDERDDAPLMRYHVAPGTRFVVPPNKVVNSRVQGGNPTGHGWLFLGTLYNGDQGSRPVLCFIPGVGF